MSTIMPPKKRNWRPGRYQIGAFIRTPDGTVIEYANDDAPKSSFELLVLAFTPPGPAGGPAATSTDTAEPAGPPRSR